ncbi:hypothetical protein MMC21_006811 [Puttea exsequens]|nr:hypothetical protein [Puttea exsequens]
MGCTSRAAKIGGLNGIEKVLHFRTLDKYHDSLRNIFVHLDFVDQEGGDVIASSLTYLGYVGVLTGIRKGLSMSLNMRPHHNAPSMLAHFRFYFHHLLILLGYRSSILSLLREQLLPFRTPAGISLSLASIEQTVSAETTTAACLIFCDGDRAVIMEKEWKTAFIKTSDEFFVSTSHNAIWESPHPHPIPSVDPSATSQACDTNAIFDESVERKDLAFNLWCDSCVEGSRSRSGVSYHCLRIPVERDVISWMSTYPTTNEYTQFAAIIDPKVGKIAWAERYFDPLENDW